MKAIECTQYGKPENLILTQKLKPVPKSNEVLIRIQATSVTTSDVLIRGLNVSGLAKFFVQLIFGFGRPRNPVLGMVTSGFIEAVGKNVKSFQPGDEVFAYGSMSPTQLRFGSYAEYICLPENWNIAFKPKNLSFEEAAAIPYGGLLAYHLISKATINKNDKVLIYGASGSIGTMAVQLAKNLGAHVTGVCSKANFDLIESLGSDIQLDYTKDESIESLETYDWIIDAVGNSKTSTLKEKAKTALSPKGKYISIDHGTPKTPKSSFLKIKEFAEMGKLKPVIDKVFRLDQMIEAHRYVETGHKKGNVIVKIP